MGNVESEGMDNQDIVKFLDALASLNAAITNISSFDNFPALIANMPALIENIPTIINNGKTVFNNIPSGAMACVKAVQNAEKSMKNIEMMCTQLEKNMAALREQHTIIGKRLALQGLCLQQLMLTGLVETHSSAHEAKEVGGLEQNEIEKGRTEKGMQTKKKGSAQATPNVTSVSEELKTSTKAADSQQKPIAGRYLVNAAETGNISELEALLDAGADPNLSGVGVTALQRAALGGHLPCVSLLLKRGARPDTPEVLGRTALHLAALHGHVDCMVELIEHKASVTQKDLNGQMPLHCAAIGGFEGAVKEILKRGVSVDVLDEFGQSPLYLAVMFDKPGPIGPLLDAGAKRKNNEGKPLLNLARSEKVKGLLSRFW